ncbi:MAG: DUF1249 domain-containing protein [Gammaproteobacteria bacterium]|nr:DUF1249 domain-containing protein [Gammaproteobacteria bacterium]
MMRQTTPTVPAPPLRSFAALMELYEMNFMLMRRLIPDMARAQGTYVATQGEGLPLHVEVLERGRFTTMLRLYYLLPAEGGQPVRAPDLEVRVYHDARVAEAVAGRLRGRDCGALGAMRCLNVRWRLNRFLYKWLRYLLHRRPRIALAEDGTFQGNS